MDEIDELLNEMQPPKKKEEQKEQEEENNVAKKFKKLLKDFKSGFDIDFSNNIVTFNIVAPEIEIVKVKTEENGEIIEKTDVVAHVVPHKIFQRSFNPDSDYISIKINNKTYEIPDFYNKKMLKQNDTKTWEMLFYYIFSDEINKELKKYKTTLESQTKALNDKK